MLKPAIHGSTCGCAWNAGVWVVAIHRKISMRPSTFTIQSTHSCDRSNRANRGCGATWTRSSREKSVVADSWPAKIDADRQGRSDACNQRGLDPFLTLPASCWNGFAQSSQSLPNIVAGTARVSVRRRSHASETRHLHKCIVIEFSSLTGSSRSGGESVPLLFFSVSFECDLHVHRLEEVVALALRKDFQLGLRVACTKRWSPSRLMVRTKLGAS